jgi:hypothetical protein
MDVILGIRREKVKNAGADPRGRRRRAGKESKNCGPPCLALLFRLPYNEDDPMKKQRWIAREAGQAVFVEIFI